MEFLPAIATVASNHHRSSQSHPSIGPCLPPARVAVNEGNACSARTSGADRSAIEASIITPGAVARTHGKRRAQTAMIPPPCRHGRTGVVSQKGEALPGTHADSDISVVGPLARGAADLDLALDVMAGPDKIDGVAWKLDPPLAARGRWPTCASP